jgi:hypothetical protein
MEITEIINKCIQYGLNFDHHYHGVLYNASKKIKDVNGIVCELGLREGGGLGVMMLGCLDNKDINRPFISIDPYGNIEYEWRDNTMVVFDYDNQMKNRTLKNIYSLCEKFNLNFMFYNLEDTEFFSKYSDGIQIYDILKSVNNEYALVHLDGPHTTNKLLEELEFFCKRVNNNGMIVLDDIKEYYNYELIKNYLYENDFELFEESHIKASFIKNKK